MDINTLRTDKALESEGIWIEGPEGCRFKIRSADSKQYRRKLHALARRPGAANQFKTDPEAQRRLTIDAMATDILLDWEGIEENGTPLPCTPENKLKVLEITELRELIASEAQDLANFRREAQAGDAADVKSNA